MAENNYGGEEDYGEQQEYEEYAARPKLGNNLPVWGNQRTMNINNLILTNIQASPYFKVKLYGLKTYHEVIDEIYYKIDNLEPWERGSRKTAGQTGMCGGVRGVGTGGIVSTSFCILYKLFTLKLTRKQLNGMLNHTDSPYIRGLGLMYIRFCQPPKDLFDWYELYLDDPEEIDPKAGGGCPMTIGQMARSLLTKLEWFDTLFPRIPVPIQKQIEEKLRTRMLAEKWANRNKGENVEEAGGDASSLPMASEDRMRGSSRSHSQRKDRSRPRSGDRNHSRRRSRSRDRTHSHRRSRSRSQDRHKKRYRRSRSRERRSRSRDRERKRRSLSRDKKRKSRSRSREKKKKHRKEKKEKHSRKESSRRSRSR